MEGRGNQFQKGGESPIESVRERAASVTGPATDATPFP